AVTRSLHFAAALNGRARSGRDDESLFGSYEKSPGVASGAFRFGVSARGFGENRRRRGAAAFVPRRLVAPRFIAWPAAVGHALVELGLVLGVAQTVEKVAE